MFDASRCLTPQFRFVSDVLARSPDVSQMQIPSTVTDDHLRCARNTSTNRLGGDIIRGLVALLPTRGIFVRRIGVCACGPSSPFFSYLFISVAMGSAGRTLWSPSYGWRVCISEFGSRSDPVVEISLAIWYELGETCMGCRIQISRSR